MRVWKGKSNVPGLNVSRSLGDIIAHSAVRPKTPAAAEFPLRTLF